MMKRYTTYFAAAAVVLTSGLTGCSDDDTPVYQDPVEPFVLNTPAFANQNTQLTPDGVLEFQVAAQPDYGFQAYVNYGIEISLDKTEILPVAPEKLTTRNLEVKESTFALAVNKLNGVESQAEWDANKGAQGPQTVYVRATAQLPGVDKSLVKSEWVTLNSVTSYFEQEGPFYLYTPGDNNGWNQGKSMVIPSADGVKYEGPAAFKGSFKFTSEPNWDGINYGAGATAGTLSTDGSAGNLSIAAAGLYWAKVDVDKLTYELAPVTAVGIIGDLNGWGSDVEMTPNDTFDIWTADVNFSGDGWKIRFNNDWKINYGGAFDNVEEGGGNFPTPGSGLYEVTFDMSKIPYIVTCTKK